MQLIYFAHSYRPGDHSINEFFQDLMVDESMTPSLDPQSDHLNAAKPERHLRSTDGMVAVLTERDPAPSEYIRWEVGLGLRARRPQLVFVEDTLDDELIPPGILQRRFSRRRLLREARDHRSALRLLKSYIGTDPPPTYHPANLRRRCAIIGASRLGSEALNELLRFLEKCNYTPVRIKPDKRLPDEVAAEECVRRAALCIAVVEGISPAEFYFLGVARAALTPVIALTFNSAYPYSKIIPRDYQPRFIRKGDRDDLLGTVQREVAIFEEDYLELKEDWQVHRYRLYRDAVMKTHSQVGTYAHEDRHQAFVIIEKAEVDMSSNKIQVSNVVGPVNIQSRLVQVTQTVEQLQGWPDARKEELVAMLAELAKSLELVAKTRPDDAERVARAAELVVMEATKPKPDMGFLSAIADGLKRAAAAVSDVAPAVLTVAGKVAAFAIGLS